MDMWWYLNVAFYFLSPKTNDFKYFFMTLLAISLFFLMEICVFLMILLKNETGEWTCDTMA